MYGARIGYLQAGPKTGLRDSDFLLVVRHPFSKEENDSRNGCNGEGENDQYWDAQPHGDVAAYNGYCA